MPPLSEPLAHAPVPARAWPTWLAWALCLAAAFALYGAALRNPWCCDDPQILLHALRYAPHEYFLVPEAWRALIPYSLTPWLSAVYDLDHTLFGLRPAGHYAHQVLTIGCCAALLWQLARVWVGPGAAAAGAALFLLGTPIAQASQMLMVRHYTEGLAFYLLALLLAARRLRGGPAWLLPLAGLAYAVAASAKEVYLPLGLVPLLWPLGSVAQRLRAALPFVVVMLLYVPWRWFMLGEAVGGYTPGGGLARLPPAQLAQALAGLPALVWTLPLLGAGAWLATLALGLAAAQRPGLALLRAGVVLALLLAPLLPLVRLPGLVTGNERYLVALWAALCLGFALALGQAGRAAAVQRIGRAWPLVALALLFTTAWPAWQSAALARQATDRQHAEHRAFGEAMATLDAGSAVLAYPTVPDFFLDGMLALRPAMGRTAPPPRVVSDEIELAELPPTVRRLLRYDPASAALLDIAGALPQRLAPWRERLRAAPMAVDLALDQRQRQVRWQFDAAPGSGRFSLISPGRRIEVPVAAGALRMEQSLPPCFRIRFDADAGWTSYSPALTLPAADAQGVRRLQWRGSGEAPRAGQAPWCTPRPPTPPPAAAG
ncbi:MAG: hypothetical protein HY855_03110 [Burkholderiales bacterium]|nr:hypothetical protein [Burkholderiales bacterium]